MTIKERIDKVVDSRDRAALPMSLVWEAFRELQPAQVAALPTQELVELAILAQARDGQFSY